MIVMSALLAGVVRGARLGSVAALLSGVALAAAIAGEGERGVTADAQAAMHEAPVSMRIPFPVIRSAGMLEWRGRSFTLAGVSAAAPGETCGDADAAWPCGQMALTAMRRFVRARTITCSPATPAGEAPRRVSCDLAGQDLGGWLVAQGWAKAEDDAYREAEAEAREARLGIWSPARPSIAKKALAAGLSEADLTEAAVRVEVELSTQQLTLIHNGAVVARWPVSTARAGKTTPTGRWRAQWLSRHHRSSIYNNAPMPYAVFYNGDYAIHGTNDLGRLGRPASAGCIRLHPRHAAVVFDLARREGLENTLIVVNR